MLTTLSMSAQTFDFDLTKKQPPYSEATGYGWDFEKGDAMPGVEDLYFSVRVPDGNYRVTLTLGSRRLASDTQVRAESRRLLVERLHLKRGKTATYTFTLTKKSPRISDNQRVRIKPREKDYLDWDDKLTLDFAGTHPAVSHIHIEPDTTAVTVFLCGNSTVVDQNNDPWTSWGQMIPRWFQPGVTISNHAESGLTAGSFLAQGRLDKILAMMKAGDYVCCEFGHNDQKEHMPGAGAWYNFSTNLKIFIDRVRARGGHIIFITPTQRRAFNSAGHILETHGDYPDAMRTVAKREGVPVIELHDMTRTFFEALGEEGSTHALVHYPAGTFPGQTKALADNTHFNAFGAYEVAKMVMEGMQQLHLPFLKALRADWQPFSPTQPDDWKQWEWIPSNLYNSYL